LGSFGNIETDASGVTKLHMREILGRLHDNSKLFGDKLNMIGKIMVITSGEDDLGKGGSNLSKTTGNAGAAVACCEIKDLEKTALIKHGRCEKPEIDGTRPTCKDSLDCCGAARAIGAASLTQMELCYDKDATSYPFVERPGATPLQYQFVCIADSGMRLLASSLITVATIAYMMWWNDKDLMWTAQKTIFNNQSTVNCMIFKIL